MDDMYLVNGTNVVQYINIAHNNMNQMFKA